MELTQEMIDGWKKQYGRAFKCEISGKTYVYRPILRRELKTFQKELTPELAVSAEGSALMEEKISDLCTLYPENFSSNTGDAGVPSVLASYISAVSGYRVDMEPVEL